MPVRQAAGAIGAARMGRNTANAVRMAGAYSRSGRSALYGTMNTGRSMSAMNSARAGRAFSSSGRSMLYGNMNIGRSRSATNAGRMAGAFYRSGRSRLDRNTIRGIGARPPMRFRKTMATGLAVGGLGTGIAGANAISGSPTGGNHRTSLYGRPGRAGQYY